MLDRIETVGNKVPHPAIIFAGLCVLVIVLSAVLALFDVSVTYEVAELPPVPVEETSSAARRSPRRSSRPPSYEERRARDPRPRRPRSRASLSVDGIRFIFTSFVQNFANFSVVAVIFVAMIGVGVAEKAGLMAALIRKLVAVAPARAIAFIIVFIGVLSSVASDAGYLILIPLGAAAFLSLGRHPLAGLAAAYAGVSAVFAVNVLITPIDSLVTEITNEAIALVPGSRAAQRHRESLVLDRVDASSSPLVVTVVTERLIEPRLGAYDPEEAAGADEPATSTTPDDAVVLGDEPRGLRFALYGVLASIVVVALLTVIPGAPLRHPETDAIIGDSPFMDSLIFIITVIFLVAGICYGVGAKTVEDQRRRDQRDHRDVRVARGPDLHVAADQPVHRLLQLQQHADGDRGRDGRPARARRHRRDLAADPVHPRDRAARHHHPGRRPEVGDLRPDLHPAVHAARRRAADRARRLPGRRTRR